MRVAAAARTNSMLSTSVSESMLLWPEATALEGAFRRPWVEVARSSVISNQMVFLTMVEVRLPRRTGSEVGALAGVRRVYLVVALVPFQILLECRSMTSCLWLGRVVVLKATGCMLEAVHRIVMEVHGQTAAAGVEAQRASAVEVCSLPVRPVGGRMDCWAEVVDKTEEEHRMTGREVRTRTVRVLLAVRQRGLRKLPAWMRSYSIVAGSRQLLVTASVKWLQLLRVLL